MTNYLSLCLTTGNGTIRTTLASLLVITIYGYYMPMLFIESL